MDAIEIRQNPADADEAFRRSLDSLSRQLAARARPSGPMADADRAPERAARPSPKPPPKPRPEPRSEPTPEPRNTAPIDFIRRRLGSAGERPGDGPRIEEPKPAPEKRPREKPAPQGRSLHWIVGFMLGALAMAGIMTAFRGTAPPQQASAPPQQPSIAAAIPPPPPTIIERILAVPVPRTPEPALPSATSQEPLSPHEIRELQTLLRAAGGDPGPLDGIPGRHTVTAVRRYQEAHGQPPTGTIDRDLLTRLRREQSARSR